MNQFDEYNDEELRAMRRQIESQIIPLETRASEITAELNIRSVLILRREAQKSLDTKQSYGEFATMLDRIGGAK